MMQSEPRPGYALVAAALHQRGDHMVAHNPVRDLAAVTAPPVGRSELRAVACADQGSELDPQRLDERCW